MLSEATIQELRELLKRECRREITQAEASEIAHGLVGYFDLLAKIYHREKQENYEQKSS